MLVNNSKGTKVEIAASDFWTKFHTTTLIREITVEGDELSGKFKAAQDVVSATGTPAKGVTEFNVKFSPGSWPTAASATCSTSPATSRSRPRSPNDFWMSVLVPIIPWLLIFGFIWFFVFRQLRSAGAANMLGNFGKSKARSRPRSTRTSRSTTWPASRRPRTR
jgi:ATP-dependent Zn protease